jgi:hypothetical protein
MENLQKLIDAGLMSVDDYNCDGVEPAEGTCGLSYTKVILTHDKLSEPVELQVGGNVYGGHIVVMDCSDKPRHGLSIHDPNIATLILDQINASYEGKRTIACYEGRAEALDYGPTIVKLPAVH